MSCPLLYPAAAQEPKGRVLTGEGAFGDWTTDAPGVRRRITLSDLPKPFATPAVENSSQTIPRPNGALPQVPKGFTVSLFASGLSHPRFMALALDRYYGTRDPLGRAGDFTTAPEIE